MRLHDTRAEQLELRRQTVPRRPAEQRSSSPEIDGVETADENDQRRLQSPVRAREHQNHKQHNAKQRIAEAHRENGLIVPGHRILTIVLGSRSEPLRLAARNVSISDFCRRLTSMTLPCASSVNLTAVFSSPV